MQVEPVRSGLQSQWDSGLSLGLGFRDSGVGFGVEGLGFGA